MLTKIKKEGYSGIPRVLNFLHELCFCKVVDVKEVVSYEKSMRLPSIFIVYTYLIFSFREARSIDLKCCVVLGFKSLTSKKKISQQGFLTVTKSK